MDDFVGWGISVLLEIAFKVPGYWIVRCFRRPETFDPDGPLVVSLGALFWFVIAMAVFVVMTLL
jgi:hypothetical protein